MQADGEQVVADGPPDRLVDAGSGPDRVGAVVERRRLVEVARDEHRVSLSEEAFDRRDHDLHRRRPHLVLRREDVGDRHALRQQPGTVGHVVEVRVDDRHDVAGLDLDQCVESVGVRGLEDRVLRQQLEADVVVRVAGVARDHGQPVVRLEDPDDVGIRPTGSPGRSRCCPRTRRCTRGRAAASGRRLPAALSPRRRCSAMWSAGRWCCSRSCQRYTPRRRGARARRTAPSTTTGRPAASARQEPSRRGHPGAGKRRKAVARAGVEPATFRFSGGRSYQLSYLADGLRRSRGTG